MIKLIIIVYFLSTKGYLTLKNFDIRTNTNFRNLDIHIPVILLNDTHHDNMISKLTVRLF